MSPGECRWAYAYPLGVRASATYSVVETVLEPGDYVVFCSDGIIEAANTEEDIFGFEQTAETIRAGCAEGLTAEGLIDRLIGRRDPIGFRKLFGKKSVRNVYTPPTRGVNGSSPVMPKN